MLHVKPPPSSLRQVSPVLATLDDETARRVAEDIRDYGHGYVRFDRDGQAHHQPSCTVLPSERDERNPSKMHE